MSDLDRFEGLAEVPGDDPRAFFVDDLEVRLRALRGDVASRVTPQHDDADSLDVVEPTPEPGRAGLLLAAVALIVVVAISVALFAALGDENSAPSDGPLETFDTRTYEGRVAWQASIATRFGEVIGASAEVVVVSYRSTLDSPIVLLGLDRGTGEERWQRDFDVPADDVAPFALSTPQPMWGILGDWVNPEEALVYDDTVVVVPELDADIVALDAATGDVRWQRPGLWIALRSEVWTVHDGQQTIAVDPETGDELWAAEGTLSESDGSTLFGGFGDDPVDIATGEVRSDLIGQRSDDVVERPLITVDLGPGLSTEVLTPQDGRVLAGCRDATGALSVGAALVAEDGTLSSGPAACPNETDVVVTRLLHLGAHVGTAWVEPLAAGGSFADRLVAVVVTAPIGAIETRDGIIAEGETELSLGWVGESLVRIDSTGIINQALGITTLAPPESPLLIQQSSLGAIVDGGILTLGGGTGIVTLIE